MELQNQTNYTPHTWLQDVPVKLTISNLRDGNNILDSLMIQIKRVVIHHNSITIYQLLILIIYQDIQSIFFGIPQKKKEIIFFKLNIKDLSYNSLYSFEYIEYSIKKYFLDQLPFLQLMTNLQLKEGKINLLILAYNQPNTSFNSKTPGFVKDQNILFNQIQQPNLYGDYEYPQNYTKQQIMDGGYYKQPKNQFQIRQKFFIGYNQLSFTFLTNDFDQEICKPNLILDMMNLILRYSDHPESSKSKKDQKEKVRNVIDRSLIGELKIDDQQLFFQIQLLCNVIWYCFAKLSTFCRLGKLKEISNIISFIVIVNQRNLRKIRQETFQEFDRRLQSKNEKLFKVIQTQSNFNQQLQSLATEIRSLKMIDNQELTELKINCLNLLIQIHQYKIFEINFRKQNQSLLF